MGRGHRTTGVTKGGIQGTLDIAALKTAKRRRPSRPTPKPGECRPVLMSLSPVWSEKILTGEKTIELRRTRSGCEQNSPVIIYTSFPRKRIDGKCMVKEVVSLPLPELWERTKHGCGCTREEFYEYFKGKDSGYGIFLKDVERISPVELPFDGPQSFRYLFDDEADQKEVLDRLGL